MNDCYNQYIVFIKRNDNPKLTFIDCLSSNGIVPFQVFFTVLIFFAFMPTMSQYVDNIVNLESCAKIYINSPKASIVAI